MLRAAFHDAAPIGTFRPDAAQLGRNFARPGVLPAARRLPSRRPTGRQGQSVPRSQDGAEAGGARRGLPGPAHPGDRSQTDGRRHGRGRGPVRAVAPVGAAGPAARRLARRFRLPAPVPMRTAGPVPGLWAGRSSFACVSIPRAMAARRCGDDRAGRRRDVRKRGLGPRVMEPGDDRPAVARPAAQGALGSGRSALVPRVFAAGGAARLTRRGLGG